LWSKPKTDWTRTDAVNIEDYNRLRNNINYLHDNAVSLCAPVTGFENMGADKTYTDYYYADEFNKFEQNIEKINAVVYLQDIGTTQRFFDNGAFISADEMNRLESACVAIKDVLDRIDKRHIPFRLGAYRDIRI
jgi:hypothetical protein